MSEHGWQWSSRVSVPAGSTATVTLPPNRPLLEKLTIWVSSGTRVLTNMTFQPRVNSISLGASTAVVAAEAGAPIYENAARVLPVGVIDLTQADPFVLSVLCTNAGAGAETVTIYFAAVGRDGGPR